MSKELTKQEFRKKVFDEMCKSAANLRSIQNISEIKITTPFKPTLSDKLIFNKILDKVIDTAYYDFINFEKNKNAWWVGYLIMETYYYPEYGWWDEKELKNSF